MEDPLGGGIFQKIDIQSPVQKRQKSDLSETIGIDSRGLEEPLDEVFSLLRSFFNDFSQDESQTVCNVAAFHSEFQPDFLGMIP